MSLHDVSFDTQKKEKKACITNTHPPFANTHPPSPSHSRHQHTDKTKVVMKGKTTTFVFRMMDGRETLFLQCTGGLHS